MLVRLLVPSGVSMERLRADLETAAPSVEPRQPTSVDMPLAPRAKKALVSAEAERRRSSSERLTPAHLLAGVLQAGGPAARVLTMHGVTLDAVRRVLERSSDF